MYLEESKRKMEEFSNFHRYSFNEEDHKRKEWDRETINRVIEEIKHAGFLQSSDPFIVGKSKVFVSDEALLKLERERKKQILEKVEVLQVCKIAVRLANNLSLPSGASSVERD